MAIFGIKREEVKDIRRKRALATLKRKQREEKEKRKLEEIERKRRRLAAEGSLYEERARKKEAKRGAGFQWPILSTPRVKIRKKRQGRKLSQKKRIRLI